MLMNIFTILSRSRDSIKLTIENVIKFSNYNTVIWLFFDVKKSSLLAETMNN